MLGGQWLRYVVLGISLLGTFSIGARSEARELTDALVKGYVGTAPFYLTGTLNNQPFCPCALAQQLASALSTATGQAITQDVPIASVAPAFSYHYNPTLGVFERSAGMFGPLFAERGLTLGKGKFNFSVGYAYVGFDEVNGASLDNLRTGPGVLLTQQIPNVTEAANAVQLRTNLNVQTHVIAPTFRYGITDRLDVSLVLPILNTSLRIRNTTVLVANQITPGLGNLNDPVNLQNNIGNLRYVATTPTPLVLPGMASRSVGSAESATGIGDIILRSKYNFWGEEDGAAAFGLGLILPSGDEDNLQGTGETHVIPSFILSQILWDRFEPHVNLGFDLNADDVDRSSFLYTVGATVQVVQPLALMIDLIGRTEFNGLSVNQNQLNSGGLLLSKPVSQCTQEAPCSGQGTSVAVFPKNFAQRNDIMNFAFGLRYGIGTSGSVYFGGVVPINDDGFRSDFIPSGGIEYTF
jgi:hypothetical protein